jgi:hypothetical protein
MPKAPPALLNQTPAPSFDLRRRRHWQDHDHHSEERLSFQDISGDEFSNFHIQGS